jgi:hypothetical protein
LLCDVDFAQIVDTDIDLRRFAGFNKVGQGNGDKNGNQDQRQPNAGVTSDKTRYRQTAA